MKGFEEFKKAYKAQSDKNKQDAIKSVSGKINPIKSSLNSITSGVQPFNESFWKSYTDYDVIPDVYSTQEELNKQRAENQNWIEQSGRAVTQAVGNEVVLGTALGLSNIVDSVVELVNGEDSDYTNPMSSLLEEWQDEIRKRFEIYQKDPNSAFAVGDFGWWAQGFTTIASTASMLIPSTMILKGASLLGKAAKMSKYTNWMRPGYWTKKAVDNINVVNKANTLTGINTGMEIGAHAILSRTMEGYMEARDVWTSSYENAKTVLGGMSPEKKQKWLEEHPEYKDKSDDEIARSIAGISADTTFVNDYAMLFFDILQLRALKNFWKPTFSSLTTNAVAKESLKAGLSLTDDGAKLIDKQLGRFWGLKRSLKRPQDSIIFANLTEGFEEAYQGIQIEEGKEKGYKILDKDFVGRDLSSYIADPHIWDQAFWGFIGGIGFQLMGSAIAKAGKNIDKLWDKHVNKLSDKEIADRNLTQEEIQKGVIRNRAALNEEFKRHMQLIEAGKNPFSFKKDGENIVYEDLNEIYTADNLKEQVLNNYITELVIEEANAGTLDLLKEYLNLPQYQQWLDQNKLNFKNDKAISTVIKEKIDHVSNLYGNEVYRVFNSVNGDNMYIMRRLAADNVRNKLEQEQLNDNIAQINSKLAELNVEDELFYQNIIDAATKEAYEEQINQLEEKYKNNPVANSFIENDRREHINRLRKGLEVFDTTVELDPDAEVNIEAAAEDLMIKKASYKYQQRLKENAVKDNNSNLQNNYNKMEWSLNEAAQTRFNKAVENIHKAIRSAENKEEYVAALKRREVDELKDDLYYLDALSKSGIFTNDFIDGLFDVMLKEKEINETVAQVDGVKDEETANELEEVNKSIKENSDVTSAEEPVTTAADDTTAVKGDQNLTNDPSSTGGSELIPDIDFGDFEPENEIQGDISQLGLIPDEMSFQERDINKAVRDSIFELLGEKSELFTALTKIDSADFNDALETFIQAIDSKLVEKDFESNSTHEPDIRKYIIETIKSINSVRFSKGKKLIPIKLISNYLKELQKIDNETKASATEVIINKEYKEAAEEFINNFLDATDSKSKKGKSIVDIIQLFDYLINNKQLDINVARDIFNALSSYIDFELKKNIDDRTYVFKNIKLFKGKNKYESFNIVIEKIYQYRAKIRIIDNALHTSVAKDAKTRPAVYSSLKPGDKLKTRVNGQILFFEVEKNNKTHTIGVSTIPTFSLDGNTIISYNRIGFKYHITKNGNNYVNPGLDSIVELIINKDESVSEITEARRLFIDQDETGEIDYRPSLVKKKNILIKAVIDKLRPFYNTNETDPSKVAYNIIKDLEILLHYDKFAISPADKLASYKKWNKKVFENAVKTREIANNPERYDIYIIENTTNELIKSNVQTDVASLNTSLEQYPLFGITDQNVVSVEGETTSRPNVRGFKIGNMGLIIDDDVYNPLYLVFADSNAVSGELKDAVNNELMTLINDYINNKLGYSDLVESLQDLVGGYKTDHNNLFTGCQVVNSKNKLAALQYVDPKNKKNKEYLLIIDDDKKQIQIKIGDKYYVINEKNINRAQQNLKIAINNVVSRFKFNKTFAPFRNANTKYISFNDDGLKVNIGDKTFTYENFKDFILKENAFKTYNSTDSYGNLIRIDTNGFEVKVEEVIPPVKEETPADKFLESPNYIKRERLKNTYTGKQIAEEIGIKAETIAQLESLNLLPDKVKFSNNKAHMSAGRRGWYNPKSKMTYLTAIFFHDNSQEGLGTARVLVHEKLHALFADKTNEEKRVILDNLYDVYREFYQAVANDPKYKDIKNWLDINFKKLYENKLNQKQKDVYLEEFLVESLTQSGIINAMNEIESKDVNADISDLKDKPKTIWQKIVELLLKLMGKNLDNIKNKTILAKEYRILGDIFTPQVVQQDLFTQSVSTDVTTENEQQTIEEDNEGDINDNEEEDYVSVEEDQNTVSPIDIFGDDSNLFAATSPIDATTDTSSVNDYINSFSSKDEPIIADFIESGYIKITC